MDNKENKKEQAKEKFSSFWQKTSDIGKKAAEGAKDFVDQTKKNIYDQQAKKYISLTEVEFKNSDFKLPNVIEIVDDSANKKFITDENAIGWIEKHKEIDVLHMYSKFVKKCGLQFVPVPQCDNVYCADNFEDNKFINANCVFGKATEEKLAELEHIANYLGAKSCSIEIVDTDSESESKSIRMKAMGDSISSNLNISVKVNKKQSGATTSYFEGGAPRRPKLKWFEHDDNIKGLIEMRFAESNSIKSKILELKGSSSATMSQKVACAIDDVMKISAGVSMEKQMIKEYSNILIFEVEF